MCLGTFALFLFHSLVPLGLLCIPGLETELLFVACFYFYMDHDVGWRFFR